MYLNLYASKGEREAVTALIDELLTCQQTEPVFVQDEEGETIESRDRQTLLDACAATEIDTIGVGPIGSFIIVYQQSPRSEAIVDFTDTPQCQQIWEKASGSR